MDLFEDLKNTLNCMFVSDLLVLWRKDQSGFAATVLSLTFRGYPLSQWVDLCNYLQVPFEENDLINPAAVRAVFKPYVKV